MDHNLKSFKIFSLFGFRNVDIEFDKNFKILIGENGIGKTSILNAIYYTLTCSFKNLSNLIFSKIEVKFKSGAIVEIDKSDILTAFDEAKFRFRRTGLFDEISQYITSEEQEYIKGKNNYSDYENDEIIKNISTRLRRNFPVSQSSLHRVYRMLKSESNNALSVAKKIISTEIKAEILYFPTYRRIEEDLARLGTEDQIRLPVDDKRLIQFGMEDVATTLSQLIGGIKNSSIYGFSKLSGEILSQYLEETLSVDPGSNFTINTKVLGIILERVGENISNENKAKIISLVESKKIFELKYLYLLNFLSQLFKIYDQQKELDNSIKSFETTCNGYLKGKRILYNESKVTINVVREANSSEIQLKSLSSGEKQIISLFAKILFNRSNNLIILFDEPELSLSIAWQRMLLPDILRSQNCKLMLAVTHSPFIFDNELDEFAEDIGLSVNDSPTPQLPDIISNI